MVPIPFDVKAKFGRVARPPVQVTIRGHTWRTTPAVYGGVDPLSFTHRRDYVESVDGAKRPETRAKRIAETVRGVREGGAPP